MKILNGRRLGYDTYARFINKSDYFVGVYSDVVSSNFGKVMVAFCLETNIEGINPRDKVAIGLTKVLQSHVEEIARNKIFSITYQGKVKSKSGREYKKFDVAVYSVDDAKRAYPELKDFIDAMTAVPF